jgi:hypothetical protein
MREAFAEGFERGGIGNDGMHAAFSFNGDNGRFMLVS